MLICVSLNTPPHICLATREYCATFIVNFLFINFCQQPNHNLSANALNAILISYLFDCCWQHTNNKLNQYVIAYKCAWWNDKKIHVTGGNNMRGDLKWPPEEVKKQSEIENEQRRQLALGPAFRPRRVNKVITLFWRKQYTQLIN